MMATVKTSAIDNSPLKWADIGKLSMGLAFASRSLRRASEDITEKYDLGPRGGWILNLIDNGQVFPRDLAALFKVGRSLITAELVRLTAAGLITTQPGVDDRRKTELMLTESGREASAKIRADMQAIIMQNLADYSPAEVRNFAQMLQDVRREAIAGINPDKA